MAKARRKTETGPEMCRVWDTNAVAGARTHRIGSTDYTLHAAGEGTEVPVDDALRFLKDPSFTVVSADGKKMTLREPPPSRPDIKLPRDQVIATWDELSLDALLARIKRLPQGEGVSKATGKAAIIELLMDASVERLKPASREEMAAVVEEDEEEDGDTDTADSILGPATKYMPEGMQQPGDGQPPAQTFPDA